MVSKNQRINLYFHGLFLIKYKQTEPKDFFKPSFIMIIGPLSVVNDLTICRHLSRKREKSIFNIIFAFDFCFRRPIFGRSPFISITSRSLAIAAQSG